MVESRSWLALTLFVTGVGADDADDAFAANDFAIFAQFFYGSSDFHGVMIKGTSWKLVLLPGHGRDRRGTFPASLFRPGPAAQSSNGLCRPQRPASDGRRTVPRDKSDSAELPRPRLQPGWHSLGPCQNLSFI